ncbi:hypothetical protein FACS189499_09820 [Clostridia bacterium]|nr:hypothetical protein FACS189499_09820 [Clostridia bacterium]
MAYIMEAADDIAYSLSDIQDGIEKRIIRFEDFKQAFQKELKSKFGNRKMPSGYDKSTDSMQNFSIY